MNNLFYFICFSSGNRSAITVVDLQRNMEYEKNEWAVVNEDEYESRDEAISVGRDIARRDNLQYIPFTSRYNNDEDEDIYEFIY